MNKILSMFVLGIVSGVSCTIGMKLGEIILDKVEDYKELKELSKNNES